MRSMRTKQLIADIVFVFAAIVLFAFLLMGCSTSKTARATTAENVSAAHAVTINKSVESHQIPNVTVSGASNTVQIAPMPLRIKTEIDDVADTKGDASGDYRSTFRASISTFVAIGLVLIALAAAAIAWTFFSRLTAIGAAADRGFGSAIDTVSTLASSSTDSATINALSVVRASLEKERGKASKR